ncbi:uncharacterized protein EURHEDRAFT_411618 [Aspergillus ruber CBS 135680]|uniref:Uncharacterized protein n=1 Tax=Aspergillus ruber (strain CBS 135680) TaxID=1388766 RepID=A0A017SGV9_ASPRC|nr:uncharacterized protein EURHEDRAFT_411618 [Aspergillus ruber CBS 135680]EYE95889.1 hypothetical protein EURHEDRAFT_411618 [Aspergillus ruber CBS 135680]
MYTRETHNFISSLKVLRHETNLNKLIEFHMEQIMTFKNACRKIESTLHATKFLTNRTDPTSTVVPLF